MLSLDATGGDGGGGDDAFGVLRFDATGGDGGGGDDAFGVLRFDPTGGDGGGDDDASACCDSKPPATIAVDKTMPPTGCVRPSPTIGLDGVTTLRMTLCIGRSLRFCWLDGTSAHLLRRHHGDSERMSRSIGAVQHDRIGLRVDRVYAERVIRGARPPAASQVGCRQA
jgi:hypothetical protein